MTPKFKKIIVMILGTVLLFIVYAVFIKKDPVNTELINTGEGLSSDARLLGNQISQALLRIEQIKLDKSIFTNAIYQTLVDRSEPITEEPIGRANPFAPIGEISVSSNTRVGTSTATSTSRITTSTTTPANARTN
jgi:hypothetical protein